MIQTMRRAAFVSLIAICSTLFSSTLLGAGLQDPGTYAKNSHLQWNWAMQALENYSWSDQERVLDIGCGDGKISAPTEDGSILFHSLLFEYLCQKRQSSPNGAAL